MRNFNEQFKQLLALYPEDAQCRNALLFIEQGPPSPDPNVWDANRVKRFVAGIRQLVRRRNPYFGYLLDNVKIIVVNPNSKNFRTMAVDGKGNLYINPTFAGNLISEKEKPFYDQATIDANIASNPEYDAEYNAMKPGEKVFIGIIAHELMHIYKNHVERMGDKRKMISIGGSPATLWNIATDIEINDELVYKWGYHLIKNGIITEPDGSIEFNGKKYQCRGISPERIYRMLEADLPPPKPPEPLKPGDIVYDKKSRKYGEIISIDSTTGEAKIGELTRDEAKARVKQ